MTDETLQLWVEVADRGEIQALRAARIDATLVARAGGSPLYGRPGERICVRFDPSPAPGARAAAGVAGMPLRAGALVRADAAGLELLDLMRARRREPLAAIVATPNEALQAVARGATALVVSGADGVEAIRRAVPAATLIAEVADATAGDAALRAGAHGLLVQGASLEAMLAAPSISARLARRSRPARETQTVAAGAAPATIGATLESTARRYGTRDALVEVSGGNRWTYEELRRDVRRVAKAAIAHGIQHGDRVAIWARNVPEWPLVQLAVSSIGAIVVTANPSAPEDELGFVLTQSRSRLLVAAPHNQAGAAELGRLSADPATALERIVLLPTEGVALPAGRNLLGWDDFLGSGASITDAQLDRRMARTHPDDIASILYTSGTTGTPKGAMLSHRGMLQNAASVGGNLRLGPEDRLCLAVPFHHCFGSVMGTLATVSFGASLVLPATWFDADATLRAIAQERCTVLYGVPTMFIAELERQAAEPRDLSSLRTGIISGAPVPPELAQRVGAELHLGQLVVAYGLTEASPVVTQTRMDDSVDVRLGSVGRPIVGAEVRAVDPDSGAPVPAGRTGELCTRGPMVMRGYFEDAAGTAAVIDAEGWLHTGDLATRDERGTWRIVGRLKDLIIRGGENVYPAEIEAVARRHPAVVDANVVGVPSEYFGEEVVAFVQLRAGASLDAETLRAFLGEHVAHFKVPREIRFVGAFPMTGSGKVLKTRLRELAAAPDQRNGNAAGGRSHAAPATTGGSGISLPLLPVKGLPGEAANAAAERAIREPERPTGASSESSGRQPSRPPRSGWKRSEPAGWAWNPQDASHQREEDRVTTDIRKRGQRIKTWGIGDNVEAQIEATGESPIMYKALGTPVQTGHPFNLYGDIRSQPEALRGTFEAGQEIEAVARRIAERDVTAIVGLGSGTSQFVAQVANAAFMRYAGIPAFDYDSMAFLRYPPPFDWRRTVAVGYSGSGSTVDTVAATRQCHDGGAFTVAFTSVEGSPVVKASDARILTSGGFDTGGSDTFHYTTRVAAAIYLALELGRIKRPGAYDYDNLKAQLLATANQMGEMFDAVDARCQTIAEAFLGVRSILVVGGGPNYGTAEEIALKFDEMAHIPTKAMSPGRHIHGALGLTDEDILTILVAPHGDTYDDVNQIAKVTQILKTPSVAIVSDDDTGISEIVDYVIRLPARDEMIFPVLAVLPGQLIPYWCGVRLGLNPDTQRSNVPKHARAWHMLFPPGTH